MAVQPLECVAGWKGPVDVKHRVLRLNKLISFLLQNLPAAAGNWCGDSLLGCMIDDLKVLADWPVRHIYAVLLSN